MNLLSLMRYEYKAHTHPVNNDRTRFTLCLDCRSINDIDTHAITKIELETLRDNAKRLYEACNNALPEDERI